MTNIQHSSASSNWYTPIPILDRVRRVLGTIDLDPASDAFGQGRVKANHHYEEGGLTRSWFGSVFVNPPGGKCDANGNPNPTGRFSQGKLFWQKLDRERRLNGNTVKDAIFLAFSIEALQNTQGPYAYGMCAHTVCIPKSRIRFDRASGLQPKSPSHANAIVYVAGTEDRSAFFREVFADLGACLLPNRHYSLP